MYKRFLQYTLCVGMGIILLSLASAQEIVFYEDFEKGPGTKVSKIKRYPMDPEVVNTDAKFPNAFPPPSGRYAVRAQDKDQDYFGLGSVVVGPEIDLNDPKNKYIAIETNLYISPSPRRDQMNSALIALDDREKTEKYYRFGFSKDSFYFHFFNSSNFTESLYDPELGGTITTPGWHTFTMRFEGPEKIHFFVDGKSLFFSPVEQNDITVFRMGVLGWDRKTYYPILADDLKITRYSSAPQAIRQTMIVPQQRLSATPSIFDSPTKPVEWYTDTQSAVMAAQGTNKKFLVFFYLPNHAKSQQMEQQTLMNPASQGMISKFIPVKLNGRVFTEDAKNFHVFKYPTLLVIDIQGRVYWENFVTLPPSELNKSLARF